MRHCLRLCHGVPFYVIHFRFQLPFLLSPRRIKLNYLSENLCYAMFRGTYKVSVFLFSFIEAWAYFRKYSTHSYCSCIHSIQFSVLVFFTYAGGHSTFRFITVLIVNI